MHMGDDRPSARAAALNEARAHLFAGGPLAGPRGADFLAPVRRHRWGLAAAGLAVGLLLGVSPVARSVAKRGLIFGAGLLGRRALLALGLAAAARGPKLGR